MTPDFNILAIIFQDKQSPGSDFTEGAKADK